MRRYVLPLGSLLLLACGQDREQASAQSGSLIEIHAVRTTPAPGFGVKKSINDSSFYLADTALIADEAIESASTGTSSLNPDVLIVNVQLKSGGAARLHEFTQRHVGDPLAVLCDGELCGSPPIIRSAISGERFMMTLPLATSQRFAAAIGARWPSTH